MAKKRKQPAVTDAEVMEEVNVTDAVETEAANEGEFHEEELLKAINADLGEAEVFGEDLPVEEDESEDLLADDFSAEGTELEDFESAEIVETEFLEEEQIVSIVESILFSTDRPVGLGAFKQAFKGTSVKTQQIKRAIENLQIEYAGGRRGITLEEINGGYQLRTKVDNMNFLRRMIKARPFRLSGPALEVLAIMAYKQPNTKSAIDEIRGVESGHLLRALMEKGLVSFEGKSELPGKPMLYGTTRKFLEIFGLRNIRELPSLSEIDQLIPEGIGDVEEKETLSDITSNMSQNVDQTYSVGEDELLKISEELHGITTSSEFFEQEKARQKQKRDDEKAQNIREALTVGEKVDKKDLKWLERYEAALAGEQTPAQIEALKEVDEVVGLSEATTEMVVTEEVAVETVEAEAPPSREPEASL